MCIWKSIIVPALLFATSPILVKGQELITDSYSAVGKSKEILLRKSVDWIFGYHNPDWIKEIPNELLSHKWMRWSEGENEVIKTSNIVHIKPKLVSWEISYVLTFDIEKERVKITVSDISYFLTQTGKAKGNFQDRKRFAINEDTGIGIMDKSEMPEVRKIFDAYIRKNIVSSYLEYIKN